MLLSLLRATALIAAVVLTTAVGAQPPLPPPDKQPEQLPPPEKPKEEAEPGVKVLDRGPIHEAFAQPGAEVRGKDMTAPKAPPAPIPEVPPETRPDGDNVKWISGYWMWDNDRNDFIWVSGFWRNAPAGREWSAGKWQQVNNQWTWLPGSWRPTDMNSWRVDLPEPPASLENGPNTPAQDSNGIWVPGGWEFRNEQYVWRPGYWAKPNGNDMWVPGQYLATGSGYSYVPGYWDYPLEDRGLLYAPVCFTQPLWQTPGWFYRPRFAIGLGYGSGWGIGGLFSSLFIGRGYNNYYYGYGGYPGYGYGYPGSWLGIGFGGGYGGGLWGPLSSPLWGPLWGMGLGYGYGGYGGYRPWYTHNRGYANPLWNHYTWLNRTNPNYAKNVTNTYVGHSIGATPHAGHHVMSTQPTAVSGALHTAVHSATTQVRPAHVGAGTGSVVAPATHVAHSIAASQAAHGTTVHNMVPHSGVVHSGNGVTISPHMGSTTQTHPLHVGSTGALQPAIHSGMVTHSGITTHPGGVTSTPLYHPGISGSSGVITHPGTATHYYNPSTGQLHSIHPSTGQMHYVSPSTHLGTGIHTMPSYHAPSIHTMPSYHAPSIHSMPSIHSGGSFHSMPSMHGGGSFHSGGHVGGSMGGHAGGHGGHR